MAGSLLDLSSGGLLVTGGGNVTLSVPVLVQATNPVVYVNAGSSLEIQGSEVNNNTAWAKQGGGTLILSGKQFDTNTMNLIDGTTVLNGGLNTLFQNQSVIMGQNAILDLHGNNQLLAQINGVDIVANNVGTTGSAQAIINSGSTTSTLVTNMQPGGGNFSGSIQGNINFVHSGTNNMNLYSDNSYTGATLVNGGTLTLLDNGALSHTNSIEIDYATLSVNNNNIVDGIYDLSNRVNDNASILMRGGNITFTSRDYASSSETFGSLELAEGASTISANIGGGNVYFSAVITFASLTRDTNGLGATVNFTSGSQLGSPANSGQIFFTTTPASVADNALGAWAIVNSTDYATYNPAEGVGAFNSSGFQAYDITLAPGNTTNLAANSGNLVTNLTTASTSTGLLRLAGNFNSDITFGSASNVLNIENGGLLHANTNSFSTIGTPTTRGILTAGGTATTGNTELIIYSNT